MFEAGAWSDCAYGDAHLEAGDLDVAMEHYERAWRRFYRLSDAKGQRYALSSLSAAARAAGEPEWVARCEARLRALNQNAGGPPGWGRRVLHFLRSLRGVSL